MSQQLVLFNPDTALTEDDKINQALGFAVQRKTIPFLKINKKPEDDKAQPLPQGQFYIDQEPIVYAKEITMRILWRGYQYVNYDPDKGKVVDSSIITPNFGVEFISSSGKLNCGRLTRAKVEEIGLANLSAEQQALQKAVKLKSLYFGLISFEGKTASGEAIKKDNILTLWNPGFTSSLAIDAIVKGIVKEKRALIKVPLTITTKMDNTGSNYYYIPVISVSPESVDLSPFDTVCLKEVVDYVKNINNFITSQYEKVSVPTKAIDVDHVELNDEIPF